MSDGLVRDGWVGEWWVDELVSGRRVSGGWVSGRMVVVEGGWVGLGGWGVRWGFAHWLAPI